MKSDFRLWETETSAYLTIPRFDDADLVQHGFLPDLGYSQPPFKV